MVDLLYPLADSPDHVPTVLATSHHHDAGDHFSGTITGDGALTQLRAIPDFCHVPDQHGDTGPRHDHRLAQILCCCCLPQSAQDVLLVAILQIAARGDRVVGANRLDDIVQGEGMCSQALRLDRDLHLTHEATERIDLDHTRDAAELGTHKPVVHRAQLHLISTRSLKGIEVDLGDGTGERAE